MPFVSRCAGYPEIHGRSLPSATTTLTMGKDAGQLFIPHREPVWQRVQAEGDAPGGRRGTPSMPAQGL
jgi:hypothetical protein